jgi:very-short-patch-repair endonuclease
MRKGTKTWYCWGCGRGFMGLKNFRGHRRACPPAQEKARVNKAAANRARCLGTHLPPETCEKLRRTSTDYSRDPLVRALRSKTMARLNQTAEARERASRAAKKTSSRPEILAQRAERLAAWRKRSPEEFRATLQKMQASPRDSKAEKWLQENVLGGLGFTRNQQVRCGEKLKQVDFTRPDFWIEVDGCWHFGMDFAKHRYSPEKIHERDVMLNREALRRGITLVRLGLNCWRASGKRALKDEWKIPLMQLLQRPVLGVFLFGECYTQGLWASDRCETWKYVTQPTTSGLPAV